MDFAKLHVCGNDFILMDTTERIDKYVRTLCRKHDGIGADGLIVISESDRADIKIHVFNANGTVPLFSGSALMIVGKYMHEVFQGEKKQWKIEMQQKIFEIETSEKKVIANMGAPITEVSKIPVLWNEEKMIGASFDYQGYSFTATSVGMGSCHMVMYDETDEILCDENVKEIGRKLENDEMFPNHANVSFVQIQGRNHVRMRTWERGCGETKGCAGAACAAVTATILAGKTEQDVQVTMSGGAMNVWYDREKDSLFVEGNPEKVYEGKCCLEKLKVVY